MLAKTGVTFQITDCNINRPLNRGITSAHEGCQGLQIDRCQFISNEQPIPVEDWISIGFNTNANDAKIRDNRTVRFKHFGVLGGTGSTIVGNHWFHGDDETDGVRKGGMIIAKSNCKSLITGNYVDNNFIEWTNEYDQDPEFGVGLSFGGLTITGNTFTCNDVAN